MSVFSNRLVALMNRRGLSQKELSIKVGVTEAAMSYYVKGSRTPRGEILARIAKELGTSADYLLGTSDVDDCGDNKELLYLQRNLGKLDAEKLKRAERILKAAFDDIFDDEE